MIVIRKARKIANILRPQKAARSPVMSLWIQGKQVVISSLFPSRFCSLCGMGLGGGYSFLCSLSSIFSLPSWISTDRINLILRPSFICITFTLFYSYIFIVCSVIIPYWYIICNEQISLVSISVSLNFFLKKNFWCLRLNNCIFVWEQSDISIHV